MRHRTGLRIAACLTALFLVTVVASPSYASTACQRRALWEQDFDFIDRITLACTGLTEAAGIIAGLYVPYPALVTAVGGPWATKMLGYAAAYGINLKSIGLDKRYACRVVRTALAARHQPSHTVRQSLVSYGLCPPADDACKARRKAEIFQRFRLPAEPCSET